MKFVLDSSVIAKLFIKENGSDRVCEVIEASHLFDIRLVAAELAIYEVSNTILRHLEKSKKKGKDFIDQLYLLNIAYVPFNKEMACRVMDVAQKHSITYYDAVHINLSNVTKCLLVTEDKELLKKFNNTANLKETIELIDSDG